MPAYMAQVSLLLACLSLRVSAAAPLPTPELCEGEELWGAEVALLQTSLQSFGKAEEREVLRTLAARSTATAATAASGLPLALGFILPVALLFCFCFWYLCRGGSVEQVARWNVVVQQGVQSFLFALVIVESFDLSKALGATQAMSGQMVGMFQIGIPSGTLVAWFASKFYPELWRDYHRTYWFLSHACQLVAALVYLWIAVEATSLVQHGTSKQAESLLGPDYKAWLFRLLVLSRWLLGVGSCDAFGMTAAIHFTPVAERAEFTTQAWFACLVFLGVGPLAAAAVLATDRGSSMDFSLVGHCQVIVVLSAAFASSCVRSLEGVEDVAETGGSAAGEGRYGSRAVVMGCLVLSALRSIGVSGIEVGLTLEWEEVHKWDQRLIGVVTGAAFLCCIPLKLLHGWCGHRLSPLAWIYIMSGAAPLGALLLFGGGGKALTGAAAIVFPCLWLSDALSLGIMFQHLLPEGSCMDGNHTMLWLGCAACVPRYLGCWLARLVLHRLGPNAFALQSIAVIALYPIVFFLWVQPRINPNVWELIAVRAPEASAAAAEGVLKDIKGNHKKNIS